MVEDVMRESELRWCFASWAIAEPGVITPIKPVSVVERNGFFPFLDPLALAKLLSPALSVPVYNKTDSVGYTFLYRS